MSFPSYYFLSCIRYLAEKFIAFCLTNSSHQLLTITYGDTIKSTEQELLTNTRISCCTSEETDALLVQHKFICLFAICCVETGCDPKVVRNIDTDVLVLMISHLPFMNEINNITRVFATMSSHSKQIKVYDVIEFVSNIGHTFCKGLPFFCAFTVVTRYPVCTTVVKLIFGMNYSNSRIFLNSWRYFQNSPINLTVTSEHVDILDKFLVEVYYAKKVKKEFIN